MPGYSHLLDDERDQIAALKAAGRSIGAIAKAVGRAKSTVSRELRRNALPSGRSSPLPAAGAYQRRRRREAVLERDRRLMQRDNQDDGRIASPEMRAGSGFLNRLDRWSLCLTAARMAAEQERR